MTSKQTSVPRFVWWLLPVFGLVIAVAIAARIWFPRWLLAQIVSQAREQGVELRECQLDYQLAGFSSVREVVLTNCQFETHSAPPIAGNLGRVTIALSENTPSALAVAGAKAQLVGVPDFEQMLMEAGKHPSLPPLSVIDSELVWYSVQDQRAPIAKWLDVAHDPVTNAWSMKVELPDLAKGSALIGDQIELSLALDKSPATRLHLEVDLASSFAKLNFEFLDMPLETLDGLLYHGLPADLQKVKADGALKLDLPFGLNPKTAGGSFHADLKGLNFPVPPELKGLVYSPVATINSKVKPDRSFTKANLENLSFQTGALHLRGHGDLSLVEGAAALNLALNGPLPCTAIAAAAAEFHLDGIVADVAANIARQALKGSVQVFALISARSDALSDAKVVQSVGIGCGLKPLKLPDLSDFPARVLKQLDLPELGLPEGGLLPEGLPKGGLLPKEGVSIEIPLPKLPLPPLPRLPQGKLPQLQLPGLDRLKLADPAASAPAGG